MEFPTFINWTSLFLFLGLLGGISHFYLNFNWLFFKQTVETLIRRRRMPNKKEARLIWVKKTLQ